LGTLTRQQLYFASIERKEKVDDKTFKEQVKDLDRAMTCRSDNPPLDGVSEGSYTKYDIREKPEIAGFPKGDSRRH
jgi:hypothetical protein